MVAFHGDPAIKAKYVDRIKGHMAAGAIRQGVSWDGSKGCAVGCTLESYDHSRYPIELGLPKWLGHVQDIIHEGLPLAKAKEWPLRFLEAIKPGANLEKAKAPFLFMVLENSLTTFDNTKHENVTIAVNRVIALWQRDDIGSADFLKEAAEAASAASAAWAARAARAAEGKYIYFADELVKIMASIEPEGIAA